MEDANALAFSFILPEAFRTLNFAHQEAILVVKSRHYESHLNFASHFTPINADFVNHQVS